MRLKIIQTHHSWLIFVSQEQQGKEGKGKPPPASPVLSQHQPHSPVSHHKATLGADLVPSSVVLDEMGLRVLGTTDFCKTASETAQSMSSVLQE